MPSENKDFATAVPLPLEPFFLVLSEKGFTITITDWERLHRALACRGNWTLRRLRNVLISLLAKNEEQTIIFERCFDRYFGLVADCVPSNPDAIKDFRALLTDQPEVGHRIEKEEHPLPQEERVPPLPPDESLKHETWPHTLRFSDIWVTAGKIDIITDEVPQLKDDEEESLVWDPHLPHLFPWYEVGGQAPPRVDPATLDFLADCMGYYQTEAPGRRLDVIRSIRAGIEAGGLPRFIFEPARMLRTLVILEDMSARARQWNPVAEELARDMELHGVTVLRGRFNTSPLHFIIESGEILHLEDIEYDRTGAILLIFSDSQCLRSGDPEMILDELRTWPNLAWLDLREPRSWDRPTFIVKRFGIDVHPASRKGIECAMRRFLTEEGSLPDWFSETRACKEHYRTDMSLERYIANVLDRAIPWAESCALLQPVGYGLAERLRESFFPKIPAESIGRFHDLPDTTITSEGIHFSDEVCRILKRGFHDHIEPELHDRIVGFILHELKKIIDRLPGGTQDRPALASKLGDVCLLQLEMELKSRPVEGLTCNGMCDSCNPQLKKKCPERRLTELADQFPQLSPLIKDALEKLSEYKIPIQLPPPGMLLIPDGTFSMGDSSGEGHDDERPVHEVFVGAFYLDEYPVTGSLWSEVYEWAGRNGYRFDNEGKSRRPSHPVTNVSWYDAVKWANARSEMTGRKPVYYTDGGRREVYREGRIDLSVEAVDWEADGFRLPGEAEWEKGARGGLEGHHYPWESKGKGYEGYISRDKANYGNNEGGTTEVGRYAPNGYGLYDMAGNVWEWCWDWFDSGWYEKSGSHVADCRGPEKGRYRVFRGGSWRVVPIRLRCAFRSCGVPGYSSGSLGFRLAIGQLIAGGRVQGSGPGARSRRQASDRAPKRPWWKKARIKS
ncbi:MAG: formylglycine-generating enzyme family protein [bacterium]